MRRQTLFCVHYRAMAEHKTCEAGVAYEQFQGQPHDQRPCFGKRGEPNANAAKCPECKMPTEEELLADDKETEARYEAIGKARTAIVANLGGPWKKGTPGASGAIDCPVCGAKQSLRFSRAGYNGHIHARCTTGNCVAWME